MSQTGGDVGNKGRKQLEGSFLDAVLTSFSLVYFADGPCGADYIPKGVNNWSERDNRDKISSGGSGSLAGEEAL